MILQSEVMGVLRNMSLLKEEEVVENTKKYLESSVVHKEYFYIFKHMKTWKERDCDSEERERRNESFRKH